jgi:hypothetical protein
MFILTPTAIGTLIVIGLAILVGLVALWYWRYTNNHLYGKESP